jgi:aryl-alcohol dehydrogenase-like predicted oxidoreductase
MSYGSSQARARILDKEAALPFYRQAIDAGINFFDTADLYSQGKSEETTGRALKKLGVRREQIVIATKVFYPTVVGIDFTTEKTEKNEPQDEPAVVQGYGGQAAD